VSSYKILSQAGYVTKEHVISKLKSKLAIRFSHKFIGPIIELLLKELSYYIVSTKVAIYLLRASW
jgi:hypothetical protein